MSLRVAYGTYTGDGTDNRNITVSPSFAIKAVMVKRSVTTGAALSFSGMGDLSRPMSSTSSALGTNRIQSMGTGTFQVGTASDTNANGSTYYYWCLGGDDTEIYVNSYTGNGTDDRTITAPNFLPECVIVIPADGQEVIIRFGAIGGDQAFVLSGTGNTTGANYIQSLDATGFTIGSNGGINTSATTYYYLAIKNVSGQSFTSSFAGNSTDNRDITAPNFQPDLVFLKGPLKNGVFRTASHSGDDTSFFNTNDNNTNQIQSFISTGFQIGTGAESNETGTTYYYYAIKDRPPQALTLALAQGSFTLTGQNVILHYGRTIALAVGTFALTGFDLLFTLFRKWLKPTKSTTNFSNQTKNTTSFSDQTKNTSNWTDQNKST